MIPTDRRPRGRGRPGRATALFAGVLMLGSMAACSGAAAPAVGNDVAAAPDAAAVPSPAQDEAGAGNVLRPTGAPAPAPKSSDRYAVSRILGKKDRVLDDGSHVCEVDFVYAGREPENLFWEEPCADATAKLMDRAELESLGRWERLDEFQKTFVTNMPGGKVLYVEGGGSASIYPIDTTGTSIEVAVAD